MFDAGMNKSEISRFLKRSRTSIRNYLTLKDKYGLVNKVGSPKKINRYKSNILLDTVKKEQSFIKSIAKLNLGCSKSTVSRAISAKKRLVYKKRISRPSLKPIHIEKRIDFARKYINWKNEWDYVFFSD